MLKKIEAAHGGQQFCIIWDKNGNVPTFFNYGGKLFDFNKVIVQKALGQKTNDEAVEELRMNCVYTWRGGWNQGINLGKGDGALLKEFESNKAFPVGELCQWDKCHEEAWY